MRQLVSKGLSEQRVLIEMTLLVTTDGTLIAYQPGGETNLFAPREEACGKPLSQLFPETLADQLMHYILRVVETGVSQLCEYRQVFADGARDFEARFVAFEEQRVFIFIRDITKRVTAEDQLSQIIVRLEESHDNMLSILNLISQGTAIIEDDGSISFLSKSALHMLDIQSEDFVGRPWATVLSLSLSEKNRIKAMVEKMPRERDRILTRCPTRDGERWIEVEVFDHPKNAIKKIFFFHDVTEVHRLKNILTEQDSFQHMVGRSAAMLRIFQQITDLALVDIPVLIQGQTGTGKELVAKALHNMSHRKDRPFIAVNCAGLATDTLIGSQLFGHKKGAFTGAVQDHRGFFEEANGGTLFLDEIGDMPLNIQSHILRFLQEKEIVRIGESKPRKLNVRVIAASQHDLHQEVERGRIRKDLLYRIRVAMIELPALCERREDIPLLVKWFIQGAAKRQGKNIEHCSNEFLQALITYNWPGNIRELEGVIDVAVLKARGPFLEPSDLPQGFGGQGERGGHFKGTLSPKDEILRCLKETGGNRIKAARLLGMSRATLYRKLERYGIP